MKYKLNFTASYKAWATDQRPSNRWKCPFLQRRWRRHIDNGLHRLCAVDESVWYQNHHRPVSYQYCEQHSHYYPTKTPDHKQQTTIKIVFFFQIFYILADNNSQTELQLTSGKQSYQSNYW